MLSVINLILIVIIIAVSITNMYMLFSFRDQVKQRLNSLSTDVSISTQIARQAMLKAEQAQSTTYTPQSISLADLTEFDRLDPNAKNLYKKYVVGNFMPRVINKINQESLTPNAIQAFDQVGQTLVSMTDEQFFEGSPFSTKPSPVVEFSQTTPSSSTPFINVPSTNVNSI
jgi:cytoskeletal protein RodZ